jgi:hypothetical protein
VSATQAGCADLGGLYGGDGRHCGDPEMVQCAPATVGACCMSDGRCLMLTDRICKREGGLFQGQNITCAQANCTAPCNCDWNGDGALDNEDLTAFVAAFVSGDADFDHDGATDQDDLSAFIACFIGGC